MNIFARVILTLIIHCLLLPAPSHAGQQIRVGIFNAKPFVEFNENGKPDGLFVDILKDIARKEDWQLEYVTGTLNECQEWLKSGEIDLLGPVGYSPERATYFDYTRESIFNEYGVVYQRKGGRIATVFDLEGTTVSCLQGSIITEGFREFLAQAHVNCTLLERSSLSEVFNDVENGLAGAGISANVIGLYLEGAHGVERTPVVFSPVKLMYAVRKGFNGSLVAALNKHIALLKADRGSCYYQSRKKWLGFGANRALPRLFVWGFASLGGVSLLLLLFSVVLRRQVAARTTELESALREAVATEERFRAVFDQAATGIALVDPVGQLLQVNQQLCRMAGYQAAELLPLSLPEIVQPDDNAAATRAGRQLFDCTTATAGREAVIFRKEGESVPVEIFSSQTVWQGEPAVLVSFRDISERKRRGKSLLAYQEQLTSLTAELSLTEGRERRRIATVLHDTVCQTLSLSSFKVSSLSLESAALVTTKALEEVKEVIDSSLDDLRALMQQLCAPVLYELGLGTSLEWLSQCFYESCGLVVTIQNDADNKVPLPNDENRFAIIHVVRELLLNVVKHAQVDKAQLSLKIEGVTMVITVADQGVGFDPRQLEQHNGSMGGYGLFNVRQRLNHLGGECAIFAAPGEGVRVIIRVPLYELKNR